METSARYPAAPDALRATLDRLLDAASPPAIEGDLMALIVPDSSRLAGGALAADAYALVRRALERGQTFDAVMIVAPSETGAFARLTICRADWYRTPIGEVRVDDGLRNELCDEEDDIYLDDTGHYQTDGVDAQLPFLERVLGEDFSVVPIVMGEESPVMARELGNALAEVMYGRRTLLVATAEIRRAEEGALDALRAALESLNVSELMHRLGNDALDVQGMGGVIAATMAAQLRGATEARVLGLDAPDGDTPGAFAAALYRN